MSRITLSDLIKRGIHNPPDGTRTLALGGVVAGSSAAMYNNYNKALSKTSAVDTSELTQKVKNYVKISYLISIFLSMGNRLLT